MNARGHRALDSQCTQVNAFGASWLGSLQGIDEGEKVAPIWSSVKLLRPIPRCTMPVRSLRNSTRPPFKLGEHSGKIAHIAPPCRSADSASDRGVPGCVPARRPCPSGPPWRSRRRTPTTHPGSAAPDRRRRRNRRRPLLPRAPLHRLRRRGPDRFPGAAGDDRGTNRLIGLSRIDAEPGVHLDRRRSWQAKCLAAHASGHRACRIDLLAASRYFLPCFGMFILLWCYRGEPPTRQLERRWFGDDLIPMRAVPSTCLMAPSSRQRSDPHLDFGDLPYLISSNPADGCRIWPAGSFFDAAAGAAGRPPAVSWSRTRTSGPHRR